MSEEGSHRETGCLFPIDFLGVPQEKSGSRFHHHHKLECLSRQDIRHDVLNF